MKKDINKPSKEELLELREKYTNQEICKILNFSLSFLLKLINEYDLPKKDKTIPKPNRETIIELRKLKWTRKQIAEHLGLTERYIKRLIAKYNLRRDLEAEHNSHIGEIHNRLTIIGVEYADKQSLECKYVCKCQCGKIVKTDYKKLQTEHTRSCGCYNRELTSKMNTENLNHTFCNKYKWYFIKNSVKRKCRSSYEVLYANYLITNDIEFEYEQESFRMKNGTHYTPDFYLVKEDKYIELKGFWRNEKQKLKVEEFSQNYDIEVLFWEDIHKICKLKYKDSQTYLRRAEKMGVSREDYLGKMMYLKNDDN